MRRISARQKLLAGALLLAGGIWAEDRLTGTGLPSKSQAQPGKAPAAGAGATTWQDVSALVAELTHAEYVSVAGELGESARDLFMPTGLVEDLTGPAVSAAATQPSAEEASAAGEQAFHNHHRLRGVILGPSALAVIDDRLLPLRADVDGYRLVEIERDHVILEQPET
jgi:hypothetical protein